MNINVKIVRTKRSDVMCLACTGFRADHVILRTDGSETDMGVHKKCVPDLHARRATKVKEVANAAAE